MIRVLKNADFSNCELGHVEIPVPQTNEATLAVAWFSDLMEEQKTKLKTFIDRLVYRGIYKKLSYLAIPYLAGSPSEAIQNILLGEGETQPSTKENMAFSVGHGLSFISTTGGNFNLKPYWKDGVGGEVGEYSMGVCIEYQNPWNKAGGSYMQRRPNYSNGFGFIKPANSTTPGIYAGLTNGNPGTYVTWIRDGGAGVQILSCGNNGEEEALALGTSGIVTQLDRTTFNDANGNEPFGTYIGGNNGVSYPYDYYRLFFDGEPLTSSEMAAMRDEIKTLCDWE